MDSLILAGVLTWAMTSSWWGFELAMRTSGRAKVIGGFLLALAVVPSLIALLLGT